VCTHEAAYVLDPKLFDDLSRRVAGKLPRGVQALQDDLQRNLRSALEATLGRLNLVTREEFEVQQAVLLRTRERLKALEARVAALENAAQGAPD
jgi:BMFP domain-containing protein YqiC